MRREAHSTITRRSGGRTPGAATKRLATNRLAAVIAAAVAVSAVATVAHAQTFRWTRGAGNNNWDGSSGGGVNLNWVNTTSGLGQLPPTNVPEGGTTNLLYSGELTGAFSTSSVLRQPYTITRLSLDANFIAVANPTFQPFSISSASAGVGGATRSDLTILEGGITNRITGFNVGISFNAALPGDLIVGADQTWDITGGIVSNLASGSATTFTVTRNIANSPSVPNALVTKTGPGLLVIAAANPNSNWSGGLKLDQGQVRTGGLSSSHNGHFGTGPIISTSNNDVSITASIVNSNGGDRNFANSLTLGGTGRLSFQGSFALNFTSASTWTLVGNKALATSLSTQHDGRITGGFALTKYSAGNLILTGSSDFSGGLTVQEGVVRVSNGFALGTGPTTVAGWDGTTNTVGGRLELTGGITVPAKTLNLAGVGYTSSTPPSNVQTGNGALRNLSGANTWAGPVNLTASATVQVDAGSLNLAGGVVGSSGGTLSVSNTGSGALAVKHLRLDGAIAFANAGAGLTVTADGTSAGTSKVAGITFTGTYAAPTSLLNVVNNRIIIAGGAGQLADYRAAAAAFLNSGETVGLGASQGGGAGRDAHAVLALRPNALFGFPDYTTFGGQSVAANDLLGMYTYRGDTDLNGLLDARDFNAVLSGLSNFQGGGAGWQHGDVNYDGVVNATDWTLFTQAYSFYLSSGTPFDISGDTPGAIPEPSATLALLPAAALLARRRRPST